MGFDYSDGRRVEELIVRLLEEAPDLGSMARIGWQEQDRQWPVRYHLAPDRANLLRHLDFEGLDVLELGAGMGGVSRYLAEQCRHLTVVEGSSRRFRALARRLSDLDNWTGWFGRLEHYDSQRRYDVICLVGVLEYSERFITPPDGFDGDAFDYLLQRLRGLLQPEGVLLLAIENRLGLKYWSGVAEDHSGRLFDGIVGYPDDPVARTFSRQELLQRLEGSGWSCQREYFPFPDYKLPSTVIDGELAQADPELTADLACFHPYNDAMRPRSLLFSDYLAMQQLTRSGLFREFANSFFWVLSPGPTSDVYRRMTARQTSGDTRQVAWHAAPSRRRPVMTRFLMGDDGGVEVEKLSMDAAPVLEDQWQANWGETFGDVTLRWRGAARQPVQVGERLRHRLLRALYFRDGARVEDVLKDYLRWAVERFAEPTAAGETVGLRGDALDALVSNAVATAEQGDARYRLFDQEWSLDCPVPLSWFILRNVACLLSDVGMAHPELGFDHLADLYTSLCEAMGTDADLERDTRREALFQGTAAGRPPGDLEAAILAAMRHPFSRVQPPREADFAAAWDNHLRHLVDVRQDLEAGKANLEEALAWSQNCFHVEQVRHREQAEKADWLQTSLQESQQAARWLDDQLKENQAARRQALDAYSDLEAEYQKLVEETRKLEGYTRGLESRLNETQERYHSAAGELAFARRRIEELYGCLHELTQMLNGRAHRWVELGRRTLWRLLGRTITAPGAAPRRSTT